MARKEISYRKMEQKERDQLTGKNGSRLGGPLEITELKLDVTTSRISHLVCFKTPEHRRVSPSRAYKIRAEAVYVG